MRATTILIAGGLLLMSGFAVAVPQQGEEALELDLSVIPGGDTYFLKCSRWVNGAERDWTNCGLVSLWEQANGVPGLQTSIFSYGGKPRAADNHLLA